jgi:hypothetical protein
LAEGVRDQVAEAYEEGQKVGENCTIKYVLIYHPHKEG